MRNTASVCIQLYDADGISVEPLHPDRGPGHSLGNPIYIDAPGPGSLILSIEAAHALNMALTAYLAKLARDLELAAARAVATELKDAEQ